MTVKTKVYHTAESSVTVPTTYTRTIAVDMNGLMAELDDGILRFQVESANLNLLPITEQLEAANYAPEQIDAVMGAFYRALDTQMLAALFAKRFK